MAKRYGGFRLSGKAWDVLKMFKEQGQDYTKTLEEALTLYKTAKDLEQMRLNTEKDTRLNNNPTEQGGV